MEPQTAMIWRRLFAQKADRSEYNRLRERAASIVLNFTDGDAEMKDLIMKTVLHSAVKTVEFSGLTGHPLDIIRTGDARRLSLLSETAERTVRDFFPPTSQGVMALAADSYAFVAFICRALDAKSDIDLITLRKALDMFVAASIGPPK